MLKVTYTDTGLHVEYCPEPLNFLLSDRVCTYASAQCAIAIQPTSANIPIAAAVLTARDRQLFAQLELTQCDQDWVEVTLSGLWITEEAEIEVGIFMTEFNARLEQRLLRLWQLSERQQCGWVMA